MINNAVIRKTMENSRKRKNIKLITIEGRRNYLILKVNCYTKKFFRENLLAIEMRRTQILMNKPFYLGLSI